MESTTLHLAKQNFKFSSAHFLIFDAKSAEMLHGHNYQVKVDLVFKQPSESHQVGYFVDFHVLKKYIKSQCDIWDEHVLLPKKHPDMKSKISHDQKNYEITFRDRFYSLPINETIWLEVENTSVEQLSKLLVNNFYQEFKKYQLAQITVLVEETNGQSASTTLSF